MSDELRLLCAAAASAAITIALTPLAIRIAVRTGFLDHPVGYKRHPRSTPYLGGLAVVAGFTVAALAFTESAGRLWPIVALAVGISILGTIDDRAGLGLRIRVVFVAAAALALYAAGLGWDYLWEPLNLVFTVLFVTGVVFALNLMDNIDGAASTIGMVSAAGIASLAWIQEDVGLAVLCIALVGACAGFLPFNLARPSRVFLGDGGSMPIGFVIAASTMALEGGSQVGWAMVLVAVVLIGLPALDTALVIVSRLRSDANVLTGARDHLTHRLLIPLGTPRRVAVVLAGGQAVLCTAGIALYGGERTVAVAGAATLILLGIAAIMVLETSRWTPALDEDLLYERSRAGSDPVPSRPPVEVNGSRALAAAASEADLSPGATDQRAISGAARRRLASILRR